MLRFLPLLFFVAAAAFLLVQLNTPKKSNAPPSPLIGKALPNFEIKTLEGKTLESRALCGKPFIINLFATWCVPCLAEHPVLMSMKEKHIPILGIAWKTSAAQASTWVKKHGNPYTAVGVDEARALTTVLGITGVPESYLVDAECILRYKWPEPLTDDILRDEILPKFVSE